MSDNAKTGQTKETTDEARGEYVIEVPATCLYCCLVKVAGGTSSSEVP